MLVFGILLSIQASSQELGNIDEESAHQASYSGNIGDNISYYDGSLAIMQTDLSLPGRDGLNLTLSRVYSSKRFDNSSDGMLDEDSIAFGDPLGQTYVGGGWTLMVGRIYQDYVFYSDGSSEYIFPETIVGGVYDARTVSGNRLDLENDTAAHENDILVLLNGTKYYYGDYRSFGGSLDDLYAGEFIDSIVDIYGNKITIYYDDSYPFIDSIEDALERKIFFGYDDSLYSADTRLTSISYKNHNDSLIKIEYSYYNSGHLKEVKYPSGDKYIYAYTDSIYNPHSQSWVDDGTDVKVLDEIITPFGGQVKYEYRIFDETVERLVDSSGQYIRKAFFYDQWAVQRRFIREDSSSSYDTTLSISYYDLANSWVVDPEYNQYYNFDLIHTNEVANGLGDTLLYTFTCRTRYSDWFWNDYDSLTANSSQYKEGYIRYTKFAAPGCLQAITPKNNRITGIVFRYDVQVLDSANGIAKIVPARVIDSLSRGNYGSITRWYDTTYYPNYPDTLGDVSYDPATGIALCTKQHSSLYGESDYWTKDTIIDYEYDTTLNVFAIKEKLIINSTDGDTNSIRILMEYDSTLTLVEKITTIKANPSNNSTADTSYVTMEYDSYGNLIEKSNVYGYYTSYEYDDLHSQVIRTTVKTGPNAGDTLVTKQIAYHDNGLLEYEVGANGDTAFYYYDDYDRLVSSRFDGITLDSTYYDYDTSNHIIRSFSRAISDSTWTITDTRYDAFGRTLWGRTLIDYDDSLYIKDSILYDADGRILKAYLPWDTTSSAINMDTLPYFKNDYDSLGRLVSIYWHNDDSIQLTDSIEYLDPRVVRKRDINGRWERDSTDFFKNIVKSWDNDSNSTIMKYKAFGRLYEYVPSSGSTYKDSVVYGRFGFKRKLQGPDFDSTITYFDRLGNLRLRQDSEGDWIYFKYDGMGRVIEEGKAASAGLGTNPDSAVWYDSTYAFPSSNLSYKIEKVYDEYDCSFVIDTMSVTLTAEDSANAKGKLTHVFDTTGYTMYVYDNYGRVKRKYTYIVGDSLRTIKYDYTAGGLLDALYYPVFASEDTFMVKHHYSEYGRLDSLTSPYDTTFISSFEYYPTGSLRSLTLGHMDTASHRATVDYIFDDFGRLKSEYVSSHSDPGYFGRLYRYSGGQVIRSCIADSSGDSTNLAYQYTYDNLGRLSSCIDSVLSKDYDYNYDLNGNRDTVIMGSDTIAYSYHASSNRLKKLSSQNPSTNYTYDDNGALDVDSTKKLDLKFDHRHFLTEIKNTYYIRCGMEIVQNRINMYYDHTGRRVKKVSHYYEKIQCDEYVPPDDPGIESIGGGEIDGGGPPDPPPDSCLLEWKITEYYFYSGSRVISVKTDYFFVGAENDTSEYSYHDAFVYGAGKRVMQWDGMDLTHTHRRSYLISDYLGNVQNVFKIQGDTAALSRKYYYGPFGEVDSIWNPGGNFDSRFTYRDKEYDNELEQNLYYFGARYYDPYIGRFISRDPVKDYLNPYSYCGNEPINQIDPNGMEMSTAPSAIYGTVHKAMVMNLMYSVYVNGYDTGILTLGANSSLDAVYDVLHGDDMSWEAMQRATAIEKEIWIYRTVNELWKCFLWKCFGIRSLNDEEVEAVLKLNEKCYDMGAISNEIYEFTEEFVKSGGIWLIDDKSVLGLTMFVNDDKAFVFINKTFFTEHIMSDNISDQLLGMTVVYHEMGHANRDLTFDEDRYFMADVEPTDKAGYLVQWAYWEVVREKTQNGSESIYYRNWEVDYYKFINWKRDKYWIYQYFKDGGGL
jgi:RHS repeat-associated protein